MYRGNLYLTIRQRSAIHCTITSGLITVVSQLTEYTLLRRRAVRVALPREQGEPRPTVLSSQEAGASCGDVWVTVPSAPQGEWGRTERVVQHTMLLQRNISSVRKINSTSSPQNCSYMQNVYNLNVPRGKPVFLKGNAMFSFWWLFNEIRHQEDTFENRYRLSRSIKFNTRWRRGAGSRYDGLNPGQRIPTPTGYKVQLASELVRTLRTEGGGGGGIGNLTWS